MFTNPSNTELHTILSQARTIALIGASSNPARSSHGIMKRLQSVGYRVIPVNPNETQVLGEPCYPSLLALPDSEKIDIVNVFRRPEFTLSIAKEVVERKVPVLWLQSGIYNEETAEYAQKHGITMIMDECIAVAHSLLMR